LKMVRGTQDTQSCTPSYLSFDKILAHILY